MSTMTLDAAYSSADVCDLTGATYRQLEHWCNQGYLGSHLLGRGQGVYRRFTTRDIEVVDAIRALRSVGCQNAGTQDPTSHLRERCLIEASLVVAARPVAPDGEYLVVTLDPPRAQRYPHVCIDPASGITPPLWVVPLRSFSAPASSGGGAVVAAGPVPSPPDRGAAGSLLRPPGGSIST